MNKEKNSLKRRDMQKTRWKSCLIKKYISKKIKYNNLKGIISLLIFKEMEKPVIVDSIFGDLVIADNNYKHLQIAFKDTNFWITAMYDDRNELIEIYIDITNENNFDDISNPYFYDLFLDIVVSQDKEVYLLDKDELECALKEKVISQEEYNKAIDVATKLYSYIKENKEELITECYKYLKEFEDF